MKIKMYLVTFVAMTSLLSSHAQYTDSQVEQISSSDKYAFYLDKALEKLEAGDCEDAQKSYDVYKELTGDKKPSVEVLIAECIANPEKTYKLGDQISVDGKDYTVAYIRDNGKHGLAVYNTGWHSISESDRAMKTIPTFNELELIYNNRDEVRLFDIYWSCSRTSSFSDDHGYYKYKCKDFSTGKVINVLSKYAKAVKLLIHRF